MPSRALIVVPKTAWRSKAWPCLLSSFRHIWGVKGLFSLLGLVTPRLTSQHLRMQPWGSMFYVLNTSHVLNPGHAVLTEAPAWVTDGTK